MIPLEKVKQIVSTYETLEKELASGDINKKDFAQKSKGYSSTVSYTHLTLPTNREV